MIDTIVLGTKTDRATTIVRQHGGRFTYLEHMDLPNRPMAVLLACQCAEGHGVAHLPFKVWLDRTEARMDLVRAATVIELPVAEPSHALAA